MPMDDLPWTLETINQCAKRGPHPSANLHQEFLCSEMADFIDASFWVMLPLKQVHSLGKDFCILPVAILGQLLTASDHRPHLVQGE